MPNAFRLMALKCTNEATSALSDEAPREPGNGESALGSRDDNDRLAQQASRGTAAAMVHGGKDGRLTTGHGGKPTKWFGVAAQGLQLHCCRDELLQGSVCSICSICKPENPWSVCSTTWAGLARLVDGGSPRPITDDCRQRAFLRTGQTVVELYARVAPVAVGETLLTALLLHSSLQPFSARAQ
jgi:hypothetical protein